MRKMEMKQLQYDFAVCKIKTIHQVNFDEEFTFLSKTDDEISLVCSTEHIPNDATDIEKDWKGLKISGILDFGMIGVIAKISNVLAEQNISIFVVSTYNTDYIFLKSQFYADAIKVLCDNNYVIV